MGNPLDLSLKVYTQTDIHTKYLLAHSYQKLYHIHENLIFMILTICLLNTAKYEKHYALTAEECKVDLEENCDDGRHQIVVIG